jgi:uncharacterized protein (DUF2252 family)
MDLRRLPLGKPRPGGRRQRPGEARHQGLDQTVIGNSAHDLVRLGLSLATADLPGVTTALMLEQIMDGYEAALANPAQHPRTSAAPASVQRVLKRALRQRWHHLAEERIEDVRPQIPMGQAFLAYHIR